MEEVNENYGIQADCSDCEPDCDRINPRMFKRYYTLKELYADFIGGTPVKRKGWGGYWKYHYGRVEMHCKDGRVLDMMKENEDVLFTISNIFAEDWEVATNENCTILVV